MKDYDTLKTRIASVSPSSTSMAAYSPTNTPAACPELSRDWRVKGDVLPPTPDSNLCECMFNSLSCTPVSNLKPSEYGDIFNYICDQTPQACAGINGNTTSGVYGAYSMCSNTQKLGYVLDQYYNIQNRAETACDFKGAAAVKSSKVNSSCSAGLASASSANAVAATATGASGASESKNAGTPIQMKNLLTLGDMAVGLYVVVAMGVGAGMVLL